MTESCTPRRGSRHYPMIVALVLGLVSVGAPWLSVELPTGATGTAGVADVAPASFSVALAAIAAWGATLLTRERATRIVSGLQGLLAGVAALFYAQAFVETDSVIESVAANASGVIGALSASDSVATWSPTWIGVWGVVLLAILISGIWGVLAPGGRRRSRSRYGRPDQVNEPDPWDSLSDGGDPTSR